MVMTLAFSTKFPKGKPGLEGKPTHFIEKIWSGLISEPSINLNISHYEEYVKLCELKFGHDFGYNEIMIHPKIHTMRSDEKDRWKEAKLIHMVINNRTSDRFQFAPTIPCISTENVEIKWYHTEKGRHVYFNLEDKNLACCVWNKGHEENPILTANPVFKEIWQNDGFDSVEDFFAWFNEDWTGKIIHWTPLKYYRDDINVFGAKEITN